MIRNVIVIKRQRFLTVARQNVMVRNVAVSKRKRHLSENVTKRNCHKTY